MSITSRNRVSLLIALLCVLPLLALWAERSAQTVWQQSLLTPFFFEREPDRHTPRVTDGYYLPARITRDTTIPADRNVLLIAHDTYIEEGATLTVPAGAHLLFHEFATLTVQGAVSLQGTQAQPVVVESNEVHPANQQWGGLIFLPGSEGEITHTTIRQGVPALTCTPNSRVRLTRSTLTASDVGAVISSPTCSFSHSTIQGGGVGIIAIDVEPLLLDTHIQTTGDAVKRVSATAALPLPSPR